MEAREGRARNAQEASQNHYAHEFDSHDREGGMWTEKFDKASDNAHHYSHYEVHHPEAVKKIAKIFGMPERHAALDLADYAAEVSGEGHREGEGAKYRGIENHRKLGKYAVKEVLEEGHYHERGI